MVRKLSFVVATTLFAGTLLASETTNLGQIDIFEKSNTDSKFKSNEISAEEMELQNKNSVLEALNTISGLNTYGYGARGEQTISIRGFSGRHAPVFIDGIAINVPSEGYVDLSNYMTFNLDKIQVTKGLSSPLLGINTFAGAINLVTKRPTKELEGSLSTGVFSGKGRKSYLNLATNQGLYYVQASGSVMERDYYPMSSDYKKTDVQDSNKRVNSYKNDQNINLKVGFTPNDTDEYAFNYINQKSDKGMPTDINSGLALPAQGASQFRQWDYSNKESFYFLSNTNFDLGYIKSRIFYDKYKDNMLFFDDISFTNLKDKPTPYDANTKGISLELGQYDTLRNSLKLALHAKQETQKANEKNGTVSIKKINYFSVGLEDTFRVTDDFRVIAGASWDKDDVREANNGSYKPNGTKPFENIEEFEHTSNSSFNPMIKIEYDIDDSFSTYAGIAKKTRFASLKEKYSFKMGKAIPNPELDPEKTINYEIGASKLYENQGIKAVLFYSDVKDYIQSRKYTPNVDQNYNIGKVKHMGYELEYFYAFGNNLDFDASYTRLLTKNKETNKDTGKKDLITDAPKHKIALGTTYRPIKGLTTNVNMQFSSSRHSDSKSNAKDVSSAATWNAKIAYEIKKGLTFDLGASNIFDKNYEYSYGYPEAGRVVYSNITYKF
ncbi:Fe(3+) dicitrate transport protein FecA precursor [Arcobacter porcinus]|uniref:TonB-dependent receptor plug domain-containing protein n=1 Tax=Arcobacter porcinus TaxID=1935204 RepID=UPI0008262ED9|nr:TonB-dependent receptor [Arcobacter porcinus]OCL84259.1 Fe(3+) dicitrate transport protein FecA precursor [Arcobacter porcinus]